MCVALVSLSLASRLHPVNPSSVVRGSCFSWHPFPFLPDIPFQSSMSYMSTGLAVYVDDILMAHWLRLPEVTLVTLTKDSRRMVPVLIQLVESSFRARFCIYVYLYCSPQLHVEVSNIIAATSTSIMVRCAQRVF